jgi:hypothetical protein
MSLQRELHAPGRPHGVLVAFPQKLLDPFDHLYEQGILSGLGDRQVKRTVFLDEGDSM